MKTGSDHLNKLPPKIQAAIMIELRVQNREYKLGYKYPSTSDFVMFIYDWKFTKYGASFYSRLHRKLINAGQ